MTAVVKDQVYVLLIIIINLKDSSFHTNSPYLIPICFFFYLQIKNHIKTPIGAQTIAILHFFLITGQT